MLRGIAEDVFDVARFHVVPNLKWVLNGSGPRTWQGEFLATCQETLESALREFEKQQGAELHEDLYLKMFDALGLIVDAQKFPARMSVRLKQAIDALDGVAIASEVCP